jgi:translation initiation factor IF-1
MAKEELLEFDGVVTEVWPNGNFRVRGSTSGMGSEERHAHRVLP